MPVLNYQTAALKDLEAMFRRQMLFYAQAQDQILEDAKMLAKDFYAFQKTLSQHVRKEGESQEWSDLSISVRKLRGYVTIQWRVRLWYKAARDGRKGFNAKHLGKRKNSTHYKQSLAKYASPAEYQAVMDLEDQFIALRHLSTVIRDAQKQMLETARHLGIALNEDPAFTQGQESAPAMYERIGNLLLMLRFRLWPQQSDADLQAGFVSLIDAGAGLSRETDAKAVHQVLHKLEQDYALLGKLFAGKSAARDQFDPESDN